MKRVFLHSKKVIRNHWFIIAIAWAISFVFGIGMFLILLTFSLAFSADPVDVNDILDNFTEEQLKIIFDEKLDKDVCDDDYLTLLARYQSYICPKKLDNLTVWDGSDLNDDAYIYKYQLNDKKFDWFDIDKQKDIILQQIDKNSVHTQRVVNSNRSMIFRYTYRYSGEVRDVVITNWELRNL